MSANNEVLNLLKKQQEEERRLIKTVFPEEFKLLHANIKDLDLLVRSKDAGVEDEHYKKRYHSESKAIITDFKRLTFETKKLDSPDANNFKYVLKLLFKTFTKVINAYDKQENKVKLKTTNLSSKADEKPLYGLKGYLKQVEKPKHVSNEQKDFDAVVNMLIKEGKAQGKNLSKKDVIEEQKQIEKEIYSSNRLRK